MLRFYFDNKVQRDTSHDAQSLKLAVETLVRYVSISEGEEVFRKFGADGMVSMIRIGSDRFVTVNYNRAVRSLYSPDGWESVSSANVSDDTCLCQILRILLAEHCRCGSEFIGTALKQIVNQSFKGTRIEEV